MKGIEERIDRYMIASVLMYGTYRLQKKYITLSFKYQVVEKAYIITNKVQKLINF